LTAACTVITGDLGRVIAIEIDGTGVRSVEEGDTIVLSARAIDAAGDTVPDAVVVWEMLLPDSGSGGQFDLDSLTGIIQALSPGSGRVRAHVEGLRSDTISIVVTGAPDSLAANADTLITMAADAIVSPRIETILLDLTTDPGTALPLEEKMVTFSLVDPPPTASEAEGFFLTESDSVPGLDPHSVSVSTSAAGVASIVVRRVAGGSALPDSAVVDASAVTAIGGVVAGSPVRFVIVFESVP